MDLEGLVRNPPRRLRRGTATDSVVAWWPTDGRVVRSFTRGSYVAVADDADQRSVVWRQIY